MPSRQLRRSRRSSPKLNFLDLPSEPIQDADTSKGDPDFKPLPVLDEMEDEIEGKELFGFKTPKRSKTTLSKANEGSSTSQPTSTKRKTRVRKLAATTPYRLAARHAADDGSSDNDSVESSDDESIASDTKNDRDSTHLNNLTEDYFNAQTAKNTTSDHTLAKLREDGQMDHLSLQKILSARPNTYEKSAKLLFQEHKAMFQTWMLQLCLGFNLLLYGYGSKKRLIGEFLKAQCSDYHCVVINGYFPSITLKDILNNICSDCLRLQDATGDTEAMISSITGHLAKKDEALFLFVNSIDGSMLRNKTTQSALATLACCQNVHIVASVDHINSSLMWDHSALTKFRWLWYDATTFEPYVEETSYENSFIAQQTGSLALKSIVNVFKSLTPNAKNIFILLVKYHLEHCEQQSYIGLPFHMLYQKCREAFLVNSDQTLRTQLTEFRDHKLIRSRKGPDGAEHIYIPVDLGMIKEFLEQADALL